MFLVSEVSVLATGRSLLSFISDMEQSAGRERDAPRHRYCTVQLVVVGVIRTPCAAAVSVGVSRCSVGLRRLVRAQRLASRPDRVSPTLLAAASDTGHCQGNADVGLRSKHLDENTALQVQVNANQVCLRPCPLPVPVPCRLPVALPTIS